MKIAVLLSLVFVLIGGFVNAQMQASPITMTRVSAGTDFTGAVTVNLARPGSPFNIGLGTNSLTTIGSTANFSGPFSTGIICNVKIHQNGADYSTTGLTLPSDYNNGNNYVYDFGTSSVIVTVVRVGTNAFQIVVLVGPPVG